MSIKNVLKTAGQWLLLFIAHIICQVLANTIVPLSEGLRPQAPDMQKAGMMLLAVSMINSAILLFAVKRSKWRGLPLILGMFIVIFGLVTFMTQIETAFFWSAFPKLSPSSLFGFFLRGLVMALLLSPFAVLIAGKIKKETPIVTGLKGFLTIKLIWKALILASVYEILYFLFGYYVAWQFEAVRMFYSGSSTLSSFIAQTAGTIYANPVIVPFQLLRGILWAAFGLPLLLMFKDRKIEGSIASFLLFALLPTTQLLYPNVLMPEAVRIAHFIEVSLSTGIFGIICFLILMYSKTENKTKPAVN